MTLIGTDRFAFSEATRPLANSVLRQAFPFVIDLDWTWDYDRELDKVHGIDIVLTTNKGMSLTVQGKCLTQDYHTVTIEGPGWNDSLGDWSDEKAQLDLWVYSFDGKTIERWALVNRLALVCATSLRGLNWRRRQQKTSGKSDFFWLGFGELLEKAPECVVSFGGNWRDQEGQLIGAHGRRHELY